MPARPASCCAWSGGARWREPKLPMSSSRRANSSVAMTSRCLAVASQNGQRMDCSTRCCTRPRGSGCRQPARSRSHAAAPRAPEQVTSDFLSRQLSSRWAPLYSGLGCDTWVPAACPRAASVSAGGINTEADVVSVESHARRVAVALRDTLHSTQAARTASGEAHAVRELLLIRFVERASRQLLGSERPLCLFLRCLARPDSWPARSHGAGS